MNRRSGSGSGIFLMEMMVVVFFFMLCASTCILAFAKSDRMSRLAWERDHAVSAAQSEAELWKLSDECADGKQDRYWNADWEETEDPAAAVYTGVLTESVQDTGMQNLQPAQNHQEGKHSLGKAGERGEELFVLEAAKYVRP